jgi:hypothetical protein
MDPFANNAILFEQHKEPIMSEEIRVLKVGECPSLSGRSTLTYHVGCKNDKSVYVRLYESTGKGNFNKDWIPLAKVEPLLTSKEKPITSGTLRALFKGKSVNSAGFLLAVLMAEGLIKVSEDGQQRYEHSDTVEFRNSIHTLLETSSPSSNEGKAQKGKKVANIKAGNPT